MLNLPLKADRRNLGVGPTSYLSYCQPWHSWVKFGHQPNELILASTYHLTKLSCLLRCLPEGRMSSVARPTSYSSHCLPWHSWAKFGHQPNELILTSTYDLINLSCLVRLLPRQLEARVLLFPVLNMAFMTQVLTLAE